MRTVRVCVCSSHTDTRLSLSAVVFFPALSPEHHRPAQLLQLVSAEPCHEIRSASPLSGQRLPARFLLAGRAGEWERQRLSPAKMNCHLTFFSTAQTLYCSPEPSWPSSDWVPLSLLSPRLSLSLSLYFCLAFSLSPCYIHNLSFWEIYLNLGVLWR